MTLDLRDGHVAGHRTSAPIARAGAETWPMLIFFAGSAAALVPFLLFHELPMVDYANHLARLYILSAPGDDPLRQMYATSWALIPNLGLDLLYAGLRPWLAPELAIKLAVIFSWSLILGSVYLIQKKIFGRVSYSLALAPLFVHGLVVHMGYINYLMGAALAFAGFALYFAAGRKLTAPLVAILACLGVLIYLCHVAAFAAYLLILGTLSLYPALASFGLRDMRHLMAPAIAIGLIAAPAAVLHMVGEKPPAADGIVYGVSKLRILLAPLLDSAGAVDAALLIGVTMLLLAMSHLRALRLSHGAAPALAALLAVIVALPNRIDKAFDVDSRLVLFLVFVGLSALELRPPTARARRVAGAAIVALIALRIGDVLALGYEHDKQVAEFRGASRSILPGDKVLMAADDRTAGDCSQAPADLPMQPLLVHIGSYLTIDRRAFIPLIFAGRGMQPIRPIGEYVELSAQASEPVPAAWLKFAADPAMREKLARSLVKHHVETYVLNWREKFDEVVVIHHGCATNPFPGRLAEMGGGSFFAIYRVLRD